MKMYEAATGNQLPPRMPIILRVDGRAFHTLTKRYEKPFDSKLIRVMDNVAKVLMKEISGAELAYVQSDEISILIHPYKRFNSQCWFGGKVQKMTSIAAAICSSVASLELEKLVQYDARVFVLPESDVSNYFLWRQNDWQRNSLQMLARSHFSHKELTGKNMSDMHEMLYSIGVNWAKLEDELKNGRCFPYSPCPDFGSEDGRRLIQKILKQEEE